MTIPQIIRSIFCIESLIILIVVSSLSLMSLSVYEKETVTMPEAYRAWVKQTGNPKELSFKEWRALLRASEDTNDNTYIQPVYIPR